MAGATTTTLDPIVRPEVHAQVSDAVFRNSDFIPLFRQVGPIGGGTLDIKVIVAANSSAQVYTEDGPVPEPGYQQVISAAADYKHIRVFTRITGHARREMNAAWDATSWPGGYGGVNIEFMKGMEDLVDLVNTTFLANATYGVVGIVDDDTTNYYNQNRATYTALKSYVKGSTGALSVAKMDRLLHETYNAPYGGKIQLLLVPPAQARHLSTLSAGQIRTGGPADIAGGAPGVLPPYANIPVAEVRDLAATVIIGLSGMDTNWYFALHEAAPGGIDISHYGMNADAQTVQMSTSGALICTQPNQQGKLEGVGTT